MNQEWNNYIHLNPDLMRKCEQIKPVDVLVGVLCKDVENTILNVLNVINEGLYRYFPEYKKVIVVSKGSSSDRTNESIDLFQPYNIIEKIVTEDITNSGKGAGVMTILEIAHELEAKCMVLMDGDLLSIKPVWVQTISNPIIYGRADLTVPYYIRDKYDGVITNNLVYPFTRALYGLDIRQPIAGEFALSRNLYEILREHPMFPPDFGVDLFIVTTAAAEEMVVKEGLFALKIHESTTHYLEPEKYLIPMFRKVIGTMFELAKYYENFWKNNEFLKHKSRYRKCFSQNPIPVMIDIEKMQKSFKTEYASVKKTIQKILSDNIMVELDTIIKNDINLDENLWVKIVYNFASYYKRIKIPSDQYNLIDSLKTLWIGRFVSYAIETKDMDINEAESVIEKQAEVFEDNIDYLKSIY